MKSTAARNTLLVRLLVGFALLLVTLFGMLRVEALGDSLTLNQIAHSLQNTALTTGSRLPEIPVYNETGQRVPFPLPAHRATVVIFATGCACNTDRIQAWQKEAAAQGEAAVVCLQVAPHDLRVLEAHHQLAAPLYAMRSGDWRMLFGERRDPVALHLASDGTLLGIER